MLAREIEHLFPLLRREAAPQIPGRQRETERSGAATERAEPWHRLILAQRLLVVPVALSVAVAVTDVVVGSVLAVVRLVMPVGMTVAVFVVA